MPQIGYALSPEEHLPNYDHVYLHHVGPDQQGFLDFYAREVLPELD